MLHIPSQVLKNSLSPSTLKKVWISLDFARDREPVERQGGARTAGTVITRP